MANTTYTHSRGTQVPNVSLWLLAVTLTALLALSLMSGVALAQTGNTTNVEDYETGSLNADSPWSWNMTDSAIQSVTNDTNHVINGSYSGMYSTDFDSATTTIERSTPSKISNASIQIKPIHDNDIFNFELGNENVTLLNIRFNQGTIQRQRNSVDIMPFTPEELYHVEIRHIDYANNTYNIVINNQTRETDAPFLNDGQDMDRIRLVINGLNDAGSMTVITDNIAANYSVTGTTGGGTVASDDLELNVRPFMNHGTVQSFDVVYNDSGNRMDVTSSATVTSGNTSVITVNSNSTITATNDSSVNERVVLTAEYNGLNTTSNVTVANVNVGNLDILPLFWRINAVLTDWTILWIIAATIAGVIGKNMSSTFGGVAAFEMVVVMGWVIGEIPRGVAIVATFYALFVGLNVAANIDYSVRE